MRVRLTPVKQWKFYERQTNVAKQRAMDRLLILNQIEALTDAGMTKSSAVNAIASTRKASAGSIWSWLSTIADIGRRDWLAYLVPGFRGGGRRADIDDCMFRVIAEDYLRPQSPSWADCVRRLRVLAKQRDVDLPHARTLWRRLQREYDRATISMMRGEELPAWLLRRLPANDR